MATLHDAGDGRRVVYVKGAVEKVLARCAAALDAAGAAGRAGRRRRPRRRWTRWPPTACACSPSRAARCRPAHDHLGHDDVAGGLTFLGLQAMMDPPRPEAIAAVAACQHGRHRPSR